MQHACVGHATCVQVPAGDTSALSAVIGNFREEWPVLFMTCCQYGAYIDRKNTYAGRCSLSARLLCFFFVASHV